jgi:hypothetical protein
VSVLKEIAFYRGRRDEVPNREVAHRLAQSRSAEDIQEIAQNLKNPEPNVQSDCLKVLYELGYLAPDLIAGYVQDFIELLAHRSNRMVWGGMIALSTIAALQADRIFPHLDEIQKVMASGSVITNDAGIKTLSAVAASKADYRREIMPYLLKRLSGSRPVDAPRYAENILSAVSTAECPAFIEILDKWISVSTGSRLSRLKHIRRLAETVA